MSEKIGNRASEEAQFFTAVCRMEITGMKAVIQQYVTDRVINDLPRVIEKAAEKCWSKQYLEEEVTKIIKSSMTRVIESEVSKALYENEYLRGAIELRVRKSIAEGIKEHF